MSIFVLTLMLCLQLFGSLKADLEVNVLDFNIDYYDPDYFRDVETSVWDNFIYINITMINYLPEDAQVRLQLIAATMGEYKIPTGIDTTLPLCEAFEDPIYIQATMKNFKPPVNCPPELNTYIADFKFDGYQTFPDVFPPNNYLTKTTVFTPEKPLLELNCYTNARN